LTLPTSRGGLRQDIVLSGWGDRQFINDILRKASEHILIMVPER